MTSSPSESDAFRNPPTRLRGVLRQLGPGLIIAGSIVGSGELIATTKTGAEAGIEFLWLIIIGCLIKVFVQVELGRFSLSEGQTTLSALNRVPGPSTVSLRGARANWVIWLWLVMMVTTIGQLGGIVGGVGQAFALTIPVTGDYAEAIRTPSLTEFRKFLRLSADAENGWRELEGERRSAADRARVRQGYSELREQIDGLGQKGRTVISDLETNTPASLEHARQLIDPWTVDDKYWAAAVAVFTAILLFFGRYTLIQNVSLALVVTFTFITIGNVVSLQTTHYALSSADIWKGLSFRFPEGTGDIRPLATALATFGIIGVGATELISYPYWCLEKGYARFCGPRDESDAWVARARGWMRVMKYDAFLSMLVYTVATIAFYVMGVAVLHNEGRNPDGMRMVSTLATAYVPVFGEYARWLFLGGAIAVLYSTFMVANASNARMVSDGLRVVGLLPDSEQTYRRSVVVLSVLLPLLCLLVFCSGFNPVTLILVAGTTQFFMLPVIGLSSVFFRYRLTDPRLRPGHTWDAMLILSSLALAIAGAYGIWTKLGPLLGN